MQLVKAIEITAALCPTCYLVLNGNICTRCQQEDRMNNQLLKEKIHDESAELQAALSILSQRINTLMSGEKHRGNRLASLKRIGDKDVIGISMLMNYEASKHCPNFRAIEIHMADAVIRILDLAYELGFNLPAALVTKLLHDCEG